MKKVILEYYYGKNYQINDLERFKITLLNYHYINSKGDNSLNEENRKYFKITDEFIKIILCI
ncbi:MAG: hypothetical protein ACJZ00_00755 [Cytophagales bacterium]